MVFSQTSQKTQSHLKVVDLNRLKPEKSQQVDGLTGMVAASDTLPISLADMPATSFSEEFLKLEPELESTMYQNSDCEFFQDLGLWCSSSAKDEQIQTIDPPLIPEEKANHTDTLYTHYSPNGRDFFDVNSPTTQANIYNATTPTDTLSPVDNFMQYDNKFYYPNLSLDKKTDFQEQFLDFNALPVVIGDLSPEIPGPSVVPQQTEAWSYIHPTESKITSQHKSPFLHQDDSLDIKLATTVVPREVEWNDVVISKYVLNKGNMEYPATGKKPGVLTLDVESRPPVWPGDIGISTPDVLNYVEQLEKEKTPPINSIQNPEWPMQERSTLVSLDKAKSKSADYEPYTPKTESLAESDEDGKSHTSRKRRLDSEDSDETYTPRPEREVTRKQKRRKPSVPIKDLITALEESQPLTKAKRGRPPKRRDSATSSACSVDMSSSSTQELKYREIRDKNNEASKRSRMNRKLKELQMEQLALDLQERNKKLKVKADILEDMTKRLKDALMTAILKQ